MSFENIIGNDKIKQILTKAIETNNILHSYIFLGQEGIGKKLFAKEFAKMCLCNTKKNNCTCKSCISFNTENNTDFNIICPQDNKKEKTNNVTATIKIEQIREMVNKILEKPIISDRKVYIIDDADKMTTEAQNCLLKTLEEPPSYVTIILIGANEEKFLNTIKSRCTKINFQNIQDSVLKTYLETNCDMKNITDTMLKIYNGSIKKALELKGKEEKFIEIENMIKSIENENIVKILNKGKIIYEEQSEIINILEYINIVLYEIGKNNLKYLNCIQKVNNAINNIKRNCNIEMNIDNLLIEIWEEINK